MSQPQLIYDRTGNIIYQVRVDCDVIYREVPELTLINCQIKEVNQKDDEIVQLICRGFGALSDTNIFVFIDNADRAQKHFQVDQIIPALNRKTIYQVGCPLINCFAQPMGVLDNTCYYSFTITDNRSDLAFKHIYHNLELIKLLMTELDKFPVLAKEEFISIYTKNTIHLTSQKTSIKGQERIPIASFVSTILQKESHPASKKTQQEQESNLVFLKVDVGEFTTGNIVVLESISDDTVLAVQTDIEALQEITKEMMFWLRFLVESCKVYSPKNMPLLRSLIKANF